MINLADKQKHSSLYLPAELQSTKQPEMEPSARKSTPSSTALLCVRKMQQPEMPSTDS